MASRGQSVTICYRAWNTGTQAFQTGDVGNHTLRWIKDGTAAAPTNSPSQVDATYAPGVYKLTLTTSETTCNTGTLTGTSSTSNVKIFPVDIAFEQLPTATPGASAGLPTLDSDLTSSVKLHTSAVQAIWDKATSALSTSGSVGAYIVSKLGYITSSINLVTGSLVKTGDIVPIYQGRSFTITLDVPPATIDLTGFTGKLGLTKLANAGSGTSTLEVTGTISNAGVSGQKIVYTLTTTQTAALGLSPASVANPLYTANKDTAYAYRWSISATNGAGNCPQLAQGWFDVKKSDTTC
jgi:hypothetical protein